MFPKGSPAEKHGKLKVNGAYLYDNNNENFMLYGMSTHGLAWFPQYVDKKGFNALRDDWNYDELTESGRLIYEHFKKMAQ